MASVTGRRRAVKVGHADQSDWRVRWVIQNGAAVARFARLICPGWADFRGFQAAVWSAAASAPPECYHHGHDGWSALRPIPESLPLALERHIRATVAPAKPAFKPPRRTPRPGLMAVTVRY